MNSHRKPSQEEQQAKLLAARKAIETNPGNAAVWIQLGLLLAQYGDKAGAIRAFDKVIEIDPENTYARSRRDVLAAHPEAIDQVKRSYSVSPSMERNNQRIVRLVFLLAIAVVVTLVLKFCMFPSTQRIVVNENNNSFPVFSADGKRFGFSSIPGNPMYFRSFVGGRFYTSSKPGARSTPFDPDGKPSQDDKDSQFCFSHDGNWVAFVRAIDLHPMVCIARCDGSEFQSIGEGFGPKWSPVSLQLAYIGPDKTDSDPYYTADSLILMDIHSKTKTVLTELMYSFDWSPDGAAIAFVSESNEHGNTISEVILSQDDESDKNASTNNQDPFSMEEDDYVSPYHIAVIDVMTRAVTAVSKSGNHQYPVWMPDGSGIIYMSSKSTFSEIHLAKADGSEDRVLYDVASKINAPTNPVISSDSKWIAFEAIASDDSVPEQIELPDAYRGFAGSPTMTRGRDYIPDIFVARTDGSECHRLTNLHDSKSNPSFRPGTHWIVYHTIPLGEKVQIWQTKIK